MIRRKRGGNWRSLGAAQLAGVSGIRILNSDVVTNTSTTTLTMSLGALQAGDYVLAVGFTTSARVHTWTDSNLAMALVAERTTGIASFTIMGGFVEADGAGSLTLTIPSATGLTIIAATLRGVYSADPLDVDVSAVTDYAAASSFAVTGPTTVNDGALAVVIAGTLDDNSVTVSGTGWSALEALNVSTSRSLAVATRSMGTAGSSGTCTLTETANGPDAGWSCTLALRALAA